MYGRRVFVLQVFGGYVFLSDAFPLFATDLESDERIAGCLGQILPSESFSYDDLIDNSNVPGCSSLSRQQYSYASAAAGMKKAPQKSKKSLPGKKHTPGTRGALSPPPSRQQQHHRGFLQKLLCRKADTSSVSSTNPSPPRDGSKTPGSRGGGFKGQLWLCVDSRGIHLASVFDSEGLCTGAGWSLGGAGGGGTRAASGHSSYFRGGKEDEDEEGEGGGGRGEEGSGLTAETDDAGYGKTTSSDMGKASGEDLLKEGEDVIFDGGGEEEAGGPFQDHTQTHQTNSWTGDEETNGSGVMERGGEGGEEVGEEEERRGVQAKKKTMKSGAERKREQRGELVTIPPEKVPCQTPHITLAF